MRVCGRSAFQRLTSLDGGSWHCPRPPLCPLPSELALRSKVAWRPNPDIRVSGFNERKQTINPASSVPGDAMQMGLPAAPAADEPMSSVAAMVLMATFMIHEDDSALGGRFRTAC